MRIKKMLFEGDRKWIFIIGGCFLVVIGGAEIWGDIFLDVLESLMIFWPIAMGVLILYGIWKFIRGEWKIH